MNKAIVVIGGGAGGMMAAICAARKGAHVTLLDPNERLGKKVNITGKGRCNVTNDSTCEELLAHVPQNPRFLYSVFSRFDGHDAIDFFEGLGVPLKVERGKRVFPVSDRSFDITAALERELKRLHVKLVRDRALGISVEDGHVAAVKGEKGDYTASAVILATGGLSYPATGSTGDGFRMAEALGHTVTPLRGSLVPLEARECAVLQGLSLRNVALTVYENNKKIHLDFGEMLFTHFGVSGPLILSASAHMRHFDKKQNRLEIDLKPALDEQQLDKRLLSDFEKRANSDYCNVLGALLPQKMIDEFIDRSGIPPHEKVHDITSPARDHPHALKALDGQRHRADAGRKCDHHLRRRQGGGDRPEDHGVEKGWRPLFCWRDHRRRRLHGRLQSANRLGDRQGRGRGCRGRTADAVSTYLL